MYLKRLVLLGFKSFANKTEFEFGPGLTCIVGPNGCGKSNVLDATRWVLGEQKARSLRGQHMLDVIFSGSSGRKAANMAQVDLVFDNADHFLASDHTEVTVSRRLYRSGDSEYLMNGTSCRLRDVKELFLDTGIGLDAYSIIEQGKVDLLLQSSPVERRAIFEEAAGVSKYKMRRREAERKLDRVDQNLLRVADIVEEVEKQLRSVKYQAGKARSYKAYVEELGELRGTYVLAEYHKLVLRHNELESQATEIGDRATGLRSEISGIEARSAELEVRRGQMDQAVGQADNELLRLQSEVTGLQARISGHRDRLGEQQQLITKARQRWWQQREWARQLREHRAQQQAQLDGLQGTYDEQREQVERLQAQDGQIGRQIAEVTGRLQDEKAGVIDLMRRTAMITNEIHGLDLQQNKLLGHKESLSARDAAIARQMEELLTEKAQSQSRRDEIESLITQQQAHLDAKKAQAAELAQQRKQVESELAKSREYRSAVRSRQEVLSDTIRSREGVSEAVRQVLQRRDAAPEQFGFVVGLVADQFEADGARAGLIEIALSPFDQYVVVADSEKLFAQSVAFSELAGRVQMFCLDRLAPFVSANDDFASQPGFVAYALDWVRHSDRCEHLAKHLLGRTIIVETLDDALRMAQQGASGYRFVTRRGQVVEPDGRVSLGPMGAQTGLISRRSELRELDGQLGDLETQIRELDDRRSRQQDDAEQLDRIQQELRQAIYQATTTRVELDTMLKRNAEAIHRLSQEQPLIVGEMQQLEQQIGEAMAWQKERRDNLEQLEVQNNERQQGLDHLQQQLDEFSAGRAALREDLTQWRIAMGQLEEKRSGLTRAVASAAQSIAEAENTVANALRELAEASGRIEQIERAILTAEARLAEVALAKESQHRRVLALRREREMLRVELEALAARIKESRTALDEVDQQLHERQLQLQEIRVRREDMTQRCTDEMKIDVVEQYETYEHEEDRNWDEVEAQIAELRGKIDRLGNVNLDAIEQQEELEQRQEFLTTQRDDLTGSKRQLENLIAKLNKECKDRFEKSFEQIRANFQELFRKLFGGGKADIVLENPAEILESGIEIIAKPPGKEPQSISLLSGGEKTMAAVALVLGIFKSRPSPFAILDEVDAALDEANNERFNRVVQEFMEKSQFIIITHSKRTMSVADVLYGVTMQEAGVSQPVSVRFEDESDAAVA